MVYFKETIIFQGSKGVGWGLTFSREGPTFPRAGPPAPLPLDPGMPDNVRMYIISNGLIVARFYVVTAGF